MTVWDFVIICFGALSGVAIEAVYRVHGGTFDQIFPLVVVPALFVTYAVFRVMHNSDSMLAGIVLWTMIVHSLRLLSTVFVLKETPHPGAWAGFGLIVLAQVVSKFWR